MESTATQTPAVRQSGPPVSAAANITEFKALAEKLKPGIAEFISGAFTPERMVRMVVAAAYRNPDLQKCTPGSIMLAMITCAVFDVEPDGYNAHIIPYKRNKNMAAKGEQANWQSWYEAQFSWDYKGLIQLANKQDAIHKIDAHVVFEKDEFEIDYSKPVPFLHRPCLTGDPGKIIGAYAFAKLSNGEIEVRYLTEKFILERHRAQAQAWKNKKLEYQQATSPWTLHPEAMYQKSAIHELAKWIPRSQKFQQAVQAELAPTMRSKALVLSPEIQNMLEPHLPTEEDETEPEQPKYEASESLRADCIAAKICVGAMNLALVQAKGDEAAARVALKLAPLAAQESKPEPKDDPMNDAPNPMIDLKRRADEAGISEDEWRQLTDGDFLFADIDALVTRTEMEKVSAQKYAPKKGAKKSATTEEFA